EGTALLARAFCHEIDHLNGVVFKEVAERMLTPKEIEEMNAK
ncbi:MAG: peptide deformylase, partial [Ruminococcus sp.]|nr:peptide deformylase [Ruminococcus sp.]